MSVRVGRQGTHHMAAGQQGQGAPQQGSCWRVRDWGVFGPVGQQSIHIITSLCHSRTRGHSHLLYFVVSTSTGFNSWGCLKIKKTALQLRFLQLPVWRKGLQFGVKHLKLGGKVSSCQISLQRMRCPLVSVIPLLWSALSAPVGAVQTGFGRTDWLGGPRAWQKMGWWGSKAFSEAGQFKTRRSLKLGLAQNTWVKMP